jgi:hypothetical protein
MTRLGRKKKRRKSEDSKVKIVGATKIDPNQIEALKKKIAEGRTGK